MLGGATERSPQAGAVAAWVGICVGALFLVLGVASAIRARKRDTEPAWVGRLTDARPYGAFVMGAAMSLINPNIALMLSGTSSIAASDTSAAGSIVGTVLLVGAAALDFMLPLGVYLLLGGRADNILNPVKRWLIAHEAVLSAGVLLGFGVVFVFRGILRMS